MLFSEYDSTEALIKSSISYKYLKTCTRIDVFLNFTVQSLRVKKNFNVDMLGCDGLPIRRLSLSAHAEVASDKSISFRMKKIFC